MASDARIRKDTSTQAQRVERKLRWIALGLAGLACLLLGVRTFTAADVGYHVTYGLRTLSTGRPVDTDDGVIYLLPGADARPPGRPAPGPGNWYDAQGRYRFPNANWLTQVIFAGFWKIGGVVGLAVLRWLMVGGLFSLLWLAMRRGGLPPLWQAAGLVLMAAGAYPQLAMRPGVLGMVLLAGQLLVLLPLMDPAKAMTRRAAVLLVVLQVVLVNVHSYFLLGLGMAVALLAGRLVRVAWLRNKPGAKEILARLRRDARLLGASAGAMAVACLLNPWTWRIAILPFQTLLYIRRHGITGSDPSTPHGHPWAQIGELYGPFARVGADHFLATYAFVLVLALMAAGAAGGLLRRRWAPVAILLVLAGVGLSARRNISVATLLAVPIALHTLWPMGKEAARRISERWLCRIGLAAGGLLAIASASLAGATVTQKLYTMDRSPFRFGVGLAEVSMPVGPAEWIRQHKPAGRIWTDFSTSSNLHWLVDSHPPVPLLTNTWAMPPAVVRGQLDYSFGLLSVEQFKEFLDARQVEVIVLRAETPRHVLTGTLVQDPAWTLVYVDSRYAVFLRAAGVNADLAAGKAITRNRIDAATVIRRLESQDPVSWYGRYFGGVTLLHLGFPEVAVEAIGPTMVHQANHPPALTQYGKALAIRGTVRLYDGDPAGEDDLRRARKQFIAALQADAAYKPARRNLQIVDRQLDDLEGGKVWVPQLIQP
jgi:hypothetical protein